MKAQTRFALALAMLGLFVTGPLCVTALIAWLEMNPADWKALLALLAPRLPLALLLTASVLVAAALLLRRFFAHYVEGPPRIAESLRLMCEANPNHRVPEEGPPEIRRLAQAANAFACERNRRIEEVDAQITAAKASVEAEKNRLAALMSELAQAVVVCNRDGRILLYNSRARLQFKALAQGPTSAAGGALIGLGRSIFSILDKNHIAHALEIIQMRLSAGQWAFSNFVTTTRGGQLLRVQITPVLAANDPETPRSMSGYVLTVENVTRAIEEDQRRDQSFHSFSVESRAALGRLRSGLALLADPRLNALQAEAEGLHRRLEEMSRTFSGALYTRWPLEDLLGIDLITAAQRRIETHLHLPSKTEEIEPGLWVKADGFSLVFAITFLAARLLDHYPIRELRFRLLADGPRTHLDLIWAGPAISSETFYTWELETMALAGEDSSLTLRDVINRHGGEMLYQREKAAHRAFFRFVLPSATPEAAIAIDDDARAQGRPEYYDFDLFNFGDTLIDLDRKLSDLACTVFDTETTGLEPSNGDEIIQFGAVRLVNGRILRQETFEQLVDPERPVKPEGIPIHGITDALLRGQPTIDTVLPAFHAFCADTVLIAHNAAFDMRFLQLKEARARLHFSQPVLDTLLLSAVAHPHQESHQLDLILERLGIRIQKRHNALDDALATAEIFIKLIPLLAEKGILTLRQALEASEKSYYARVRY